MEAANHQKVIIYQTTKNLCRMNIIHQFMKTEVASHPRDTLYHMIIPSLEKEAANRARVQQVVWMKLTTHCRQALLRCHFHQAHQQAQQELFVLPQSIQIPLPYHQCLPPRARNPLLHMVLKVTNHPRHMSLKVTSHHKVHCIPQLLQRQEGLQYQQQPQPEVTHRNHLHLAQVRVP